MQHTVRGGVVSFIPEELQDRGLTAETNNSREQSPTQLTETNALNYQFSYLNQWTQSLSIVSDSNIQ